MNAHRTFFALSLIASILCTLTMSADAPFTTQIDGMVGKIPLKICWYIKKLQEDPTQSYETFSNRLLLYGPPGNGKTTIARKMAELTNSNFYVLNAPSIVTKFAGSGPETIRSAFQDIRAKIFAEGRRVILFIDEIDAIAANVGTEYRSEHKLALQQLWLELDACKGDTRIFAIFATNHFDKLNKTFLDRFGSNVIKIDNPCTDTRLDALKMYFEKHGISVDDALLYKIAKMTKGLSIRCLEDLVQEISMLAEIHNDGVPTTEMVWQALAHTKSKFNNNKSTDTDDSAEQRALQHTLNKVGLISNSIGLIGGLLTIILHGETLRAKFWPNEKEQERERLQDLGLLLNSAHLSKMLRLHENGKLVQMIQRSPIYKKECQAEDLEKDMRSDNEVVREQMNDENLIMTQLKTRKEMRLFENEKLRAQIQSHYFYHENTAGPDLAKDLRSEKERLREEIHDNSAIISLLNQQKSLRLNENADLVKAITMCPVFTKGVLTSELKYELRSSAEITREDINSWSGWFTWGGGAYTAYRAVSWPVRKTYQVTAWTAKKSYETVSGLVG